MKEHVIQKLSWLGIISANLLILLVAFWMFWPYRLIDFKKGPQKVLTKVVKVGSHLVYENEYCKYTSIVPVVSKTFVDGVIYVTPPNVAVEKPLGCGKIQVQIYVPRALVSGKYIIKSTYRYQVNPIRYIDVVTETERFEVTSYK